MHKNIRQRGASRTTTAALLGETAAAAAINVLPLYEPSKNANNNAYRNKDPRYRQRQRLRRDWVIPLLFVILLGGSCCIVLVLGRWWSFLPRRHFEDTFSSSSDGSLTLSNQTHQTVQGYRQDTKSFPDGDDDDRNPKSISDDRRQRHGDSSTDDDGSSHDDGTRRSISKDSKDIPSTPGRERSKQKALRGADRIFQEDHAVQNSDAKLKSDEHLEPRDAAIKPEQSSKPSSNSKTFELSESNKIRQCTWDDLAAHAQDVTEGDDHPNDHDQKPQSCWNLSDDLIYIEQSGVHIQRRNDTTILIPKKGNENTPCLLHYEMWPSSQELSESYWLDAILPILAQHREVTIHEHGLQSNPSVALLWSPDQQKVTGRLRLFSQQIPVTDWSQTPIPVARLWLDLAKALLNTGQTIEQLIQRKVGVLPSACDYYGSDRTFMGYGSASSESVSCLAIQYEILSFGAMKGFKSQPLYQDISSLRNCDLKHITTSIENYIASEQQTILPFVFRHKIQNLTLAFEDAGEPNPSTLSSLDPWKSPYDWFVAKETYLSSVNNHQSAANGRMLDLFQNPGGGGSYVSFSMRNSSLWASFRSSMSEGEWEKPTQIPLLSPFITLPATSTPSIYMERNGTITVLLDTCTQRSDDDVFSCFSIMQARNGCKPGHCDNWELVKSNVIPKGGFSPADESSDASSCSPHVEQPTTWFDTPTQKWRMLMQQSPAHRNDPGKCIVDRDSHYSHSGGYAETEGPFVGGTWKYTAFESAYSNWVNTTDAKRNHFPHDYSRRERPRVILSADGGLDGCYIVTHACDEISKDLASCDIVAQQVLRTSSKPEERPSGTIILMTHADTKRPRYPYGINQKGFSHANWMARYFNNLDTIEETPKTFIAGQIKDVFHRGQRLEGTITPWAHSNGLNVTKGPILSQDDDGPDYELLQMIYKGLEKGPVAICLWHAIYELCNMLGTYCDDFDRHSGEYKIFKLEEGRVVSQEDGVDGFLMDFRKRNSKKPIPDMSWDELPYDIEMALSHIGYNAKLWSTDETPNMNEWDRLDDATRNAAIQLGYDQKSWNDKDEVPISVEEFFDKERQLSTWKISDSLWYDFPRTLKTTLEAIGYDHDTWDDEKETKRSKPWNSLSVSEKEAASRLGLNEKGWNENHSVAMTIAEFFDHLSQ